MSIYAIGDLHLSRAPEIQKPMDVFGPEWGDHDARLKENWLRLIGAEDTTILCGDISWGLKLQEALPDLEWIDALPGKKIITKGNHDLWWTSLSKIAGTGKSLTFLQNTAVLVGKTAICGTRGWICPGTEGFDAHDEKIYKREVLRLSLSLEQAENLGAEEIIVSLHYPPTNSRMQPSAFTEMLTQRGVSTCVYGHLHGQESFRHGLKGMYGGVDYHLVSLDYVNAKPLLIRP